MRLEDLPGLGKKSAAQLQRIGIYTKADLEKTGALAAYIQLGQCSDSKPSLNFLYAMVGALQDRDWRDVARHDRADLLLQLDAYAQQQAMLADS